MIKKPSTEEAKQAIRTLLKYIGEDLNREGLVETPRRVVESYAEFFRGYKKDPKRILKETFEDVGEYNDIPKLHGTKEPDGCFINEDSKQIIILEKKFQNGGGSVAEKLQTPVNKIRNLSRRYVSYKIFYIYWLSDWFKDNAKAELLDLVEDKIPYFIGLSYDIKTKVVQQINNCK